MVITFYFTKSCAFERSPTKFIEINNLNIWCIQILLYYSKELITHLFYILLNRPRSLQKDKEQGNRQKQYLFILWTNKWRHFSLALIPPFFPNKNNIMFPNQTYYGDIMYIQLYRAESQDKYKSKRMYSCHRFNGFPLTSS